MVERTAGQERGRPRHLPWLWSTPPHPTRSVQRRGLRSPRQRALSCGLRLQPPVQVLQQLGTCRGLQLQVRQGGRPHPVLAVRGHEQLWRVAWRVLHGGGGRHPLAPSWWQRRRTKATCSPSSPSLHHLDRDQLTLQKSTPSSQRRVGA